MSVSSNLNVWRRRVAVARREIRATALLASPVVIAQLAHMSMGFVDTVMVGRLGPRALAGVALGSTTFFFLMIVSSGVLAAVGPMVSQAHGAGQKEPIARSVRQGIWLAVILAGPSAAILWNAGPALIAIGQEPAAVHLTEGYLRAICWSLFPALGFVALRSFVEGLARPLPVTIITIGGVLLNIGANYVLMFGAFGWQGMGLTGTGWASTIVYTSMVVALALFVRRFEPFASYDVLSKLRVPDWSYLREIGRIGWPIGVSSGVQSGLFLATTFLVGWFGTTALAAHQIAIQSASFTFMVPLGIGIATGVRVGQAAGRRSPEGVRRAGWAGIALGGLVMLVAAVLFWVFPETIVSLYIEVDETRNIPVAELAAMLIGVAAVFQFVDGIQICAAGALRGLKDTRFPMFIALGAYWGIGMTAGYGLAFVAGFGAPGLWYGLVLGLTTAALLLVWRFIAQTRDSSWVQIPTH